MGDLELATDELHDLGGRLNTLSTRLKTTDGGASYDRGDLAHDDVIDAMTTFRTNWDDNRDHLADKLAKLGEMAKATADEFTKADEELASELLDAVEGAKK